MEEDTSEGTPLFQCIQCSPLIFYIMLSAGVLYDMTTLASLMICWKFPLWNL